MRLRTYINQDIYGEGATEEDCIKDALARFKLLLAEFGTDVVSIDNDDDDDDDDDDEDWGCGNCGESVKESTVICPACGAYLGDDDEDEKLVCGHCDKTWEGGDGYDGLCPECADRVQANGNATWEQARSEIEDIAARRAYTAGLGVSEWKAFL